jgi:D-lyxose ketol-isomerase
MSFNKKMVQKLLNQALKHGGRAMKQGGGSASGFSEKQMVDKLANSAPMQAAARKAVDIVNNVQETDWRGELRDRMQKMEDALEAREQAQNKKKGGWW